MKDFFTLLDRNKKFFLLTLFVGLIFSAIDVAGPTLSGRLISAVISGHPDRMGLLCAFLLLSVFQICFSTLDEFLSRTLKIRQKKQMRQLAFRAFSAHDSAGREQISTFVSFVNNDIPAVAEQYVQGTIDIIKCIAIICFSALSLLAIHWALALVIVSVSLLIVLLPNTMRKRGGAARKQYSGFMARYNTTLRSILDGLNLVKAYRAKAYADRSVDGADAGVVQAERAMLRHSMLVQALTALLQVGKNVLILLIGIRLVSKNEIEIGSLVAVIQLAEVIGSPIEYLAYLRHMRNEALPLLAQYRQLLCQREEGADERMACAGEFRQLSVEHVSYCADELKILTDVCASFRAGGKYLITGESGSGKSTLLRLLAQLGELHYGGSIRFNQREIRTIPYSTYYGTVCPVFQEPYLFYATLEENICLGRPIPEERYTAVIDALHLSYLLERCQDQELTPELMETLSGGERQRVALARAMVGQPAVYLLDEVTSALDQSNAERVERLLLRQPATIVHVCHKPNPALLEQYDAVYELVDGRLSPVSFAART